MVYTDHKPLIHALQSHSDKYSEREFRQLDFLSQFNLEFRHVHGRDNEVADALSRISINAVLLGIDYEQMAAEQRSKGISISSADPHLQELPVPNGTGNLVCNTKAGDPRPIVASTLREKVFHLLHNLSHPGSRPHVGQELWGVPTT